MAQIDMRAGWWMWGLSAAGLALGLAPQPARACSWDCTPGYFLPSSGSTIPANTPVLVWRTGKGDVVSDAGSTRLQLERAQGQGSRAVAFHVEDQEGESWLVLDEVLIVGGRYRLTEQGACAARAVEFQVGAPAPLPESLGELKLSAPSTRAVGVATVSGSCSTSVAAVGAVTEVELSAEAEPWSALLAFHPVVDGEPFLPRRTVVPEPLPVSAVATLYAECPALYPSEMERDDGAPDQGLSEGAHSVTLEARLPGVDAALSTASMRVRFDCPLKGAVAGAGVPKDDQDDDAAPGTSDEPKESSASDCSARPATRASRPLHWLALLALGWVWRRRRIAGPARRPGRRPGSRTHAFGLRSCGPWPESPA